MDILVNPITLQPDPTGIPVNPDALKAAQEQLAKCLAEEQQRLKQ
jgi:hypothetical protein